MTVTGWPLGPESEVAVSIGVARHAERPGRGALPELVDEAVEAGLVRDADGDQLGLVARVPAGRPAGRPSPATIPGWPSRVGALVGEALGRTVAVGLGDEGGVVAGLADREADAVGVGVGDEPTSGWGPHALTTTMPRARASAP